MEKIKTIQPLTETNKWREDFPVDEFKEQFVERREFTKFLMLISGSFVIGQVYIGLQNIFRKVSEQYPITKIASISDIPEKNYLMFNYPKKSDACILIRLSRSKFVAFSNKCTHLMCPVIPKIEEKKLYCPCHAGYFDLATGNPLAGPPPRPLAQVKLKVSGGNIYAEGMMT